MSASSPSRSGVLEAIRESLAAALVAADGLEEWLLVALTSQAHDAANALLSEDPVGFDPRPLGAASAFIDPETQGACRLRISRPDC